MYRELINYFVPQFFFFIRSSTCTAIAFYISPPSFPLSSFFPISPFLHCVPARGLPLENVTATILSYAVSHLNEGTGNCGKPVPLQSAISQSLPQSTVSEKKTSRSVFRYAGRRPAITHPSTDSAPSCLTCVTCLVPDTYHTFFFLFIDTRPRKKVHNEENNRSVNSLTYIIVFFV